MAFENQENKNERRNREYVFSPGRIKSAASKFGFNQGKLIDLLKNIDITVQWPYGRFAELFGNWIYDWGPRNYFLKEIVSNIIYYIILNIESRTKIINRIERDSNSDEENTMKAEDGHFTKIPEEVDFELKGEGDE